MKAARLNETLPARFKTTSANWADNHRLYRNENVCFFIQKIKMKINKQKTHVIRISFTGNCSEKESTRIITISNILFLSTFWKILLFVKKRRDANGFRLNVLFDSTLS